VTGWLCIQIFLSFLFFAKIVLYLLRGETSNLCSKFMLASYRNRIPLYNCYSILFIALAELVCKFKKKIKNTFCTYLCRQCFHSPTVFACAWLSFSHRHRSAFCARCARADAAATGIWSVAIFLAFYAIWCKRRWIKAGCRTSISMRSEMVKSVKKFS